MAPREEPGKMRQEGANKPVIKPDRQDVRRPFVSTLPAERQPPERVRNIRPEEMKVQRKLVGKREGAIYLIIPFKPSRDPSTSFRTFTTFSKSSPMACWDV